MALLGYKPNEVFTPKKHAVNSRMYIPRPTLERQVLNAARGPKHFIIHGESGNGKSWLYKHVFDTNKVTYTSINLAKANILGSVMAAIQERVDGYAAARTSETEVTHDGNFSPGRVGYNQKRTVKSVHSKPDPLKELFHYHKGTKRHPGIIVFENFEVATENSDVLQELSNLIVLLDDEDYADFNMRFCFVGVPSKIRDYLAQQNNRTTIMGRLSEVDEVARLRPGQARQILEMGFEKLLRFRFKEGEKKDYIYERLISVSDRIASEVQALGLHVAVAADENDGTIEDLLIYDAVDRWMAESHSAIRETLQERLNRAPGGRRSQCMYCLGKLDSEDFTVADVENLMLFEFGESINGRRVDVGAALRQLSSGDNPPLKRTPNGKAFRFSSPRYRMAIRAMLQKDGQHVLLDQPEL